MLLVWFFNQNAELMADLSARDAWIEKLRDTLNRIRSTPRTIRLTERPDSGVEVPSRTVFESSLDELGYKATEDPKAIPI